MFTKIESLLYNLLEGFTCSYVLYSTGHGYKNIFNFNRIVLLDGDKRIEIPSEKFERSTLIETNYETIKRIEESLQKKVNAPNQEEKFILLKKF